MFSALSLTLLAATPSTFTIAAPGFRCGGIEDAICDAYLDHFSTVLTRSGRLAVRTRSDLQQLLGVERQKQLLGCSDGSCLVELVGGLGVEAVLGGGVTKTESGYIATLRVLRARDGSELVTASERFGGAAAMEAWLDDQAEAFAEKLAPAPPPAPVNKGRVALLVGGGVLFAAGAGLFGWSKADAAALRSGSAGPSVADRGSFTQKLGLTLGIIGAAALVGGLVWLLLDSDAPVATVAPVAGGGAMFGITGRLP